MKSQTLLAALALVCLTSSAADAPRQINLLSQKAPGCKYEGEDFEVGARVCRGGQFWDCGADGEWTNVGIKCNKKR